MTMAARQRSDSETKKNLISKTLDQRVFAQLEKHSSFVSIFGGRRLSTDKKGM